MLNFWNYFLKYPIPVVDVFITLLPVFFILRNRKSRIDNILLGLLLFKLVSGGLNIYLSIHQINNLLVHNFSILITSLCVMGLFYNYEPLKDKRKFIDTLMFGFVIIYLYDTIYSNTFEEYQEILYLKYSETVQSFIAILLCLVYFWDLLKTLRVPSLLDDSFFYVVSGILLLNCSYIFLSPLYHYICRWMTGSAGIEDNMPDIFEILFYILISTGYGINTRNELQQSSDQSSKRFAFSSQQKFQYSDWNTKSNAGN